MSDESQQPEVSESELIRVRREKLDRIAALGFDAYPTKADVDTTIAEVVAAYGDKSGEELDAAKTSVKIAGRIMGIRAFGKAAFLVLSEKTARIQVYCRMDSLPEREWALYQNLDAGDWVEVAGTVFRTKTNELSVKASHLGFLVKALRPLPSKWHGLTDVRAAVPAAVRRSHRERQRQGDVRDARENRPLHSQLLRWAWVHRSGDADDAADRERRGGPAVSHASQRARHRPVHAHRAGALPQAAHRRRTVARVRDQPQLPQRGDLHAAQPRVHDAGVLRGIR